MVNYSIEFNFRKTNNDMLVNFICHVSQDQPIKSFHLTGICTKMIREIFQCFYYIVYDMIYYIV